MPADNTDEGTFALTRIAWERYEGDDIESVVAMLVNREFPNSVRISPSKGDGGVDILNRRATAAGGDVVYQVKRYTKALTNGQQKKVEESWERLRSDARWDTLDLEEWHLVTPWDPTPEAEAWLQNLCGGSCRVYWHGLTYLDNLASKYPEVIDYYLESGKSRIEAAYQTVLSLFSPTEAGQPLNVPNVSSKLSKAIATLEDDPHYRYELRFGAGELPEPVDRPNLMMTCIRSTGPDKKWEAVDIIARCAASPIERPIVVSGTIRAEKNSDLATAIQDFHDFGTPLSTPRGTFTGSVDAPGGLGGPLTDAGLQIIPVNDASNEDPNLILEARSPSGEAITHTEVTRIERSEGAKGLRVVLRQTNEVFTIEDRYTSLKEGSRQLRFGDYMNQPAHEVRDALNFLTSAAPPNTVTIRRKGAPARSAITDPTWSFTLPSEIFEDLNRAAEVVNELAVLQQHTGTIVRVPDLMKTTDAQVAMWRRAATMLEGGEVTGTFSEGHALTIRIENKFDSIPELLVVEVPFEVSVGEQNIHFGTKYVWLEKATVIEQREIDGEWLLTLTTPDRRIRFSLADNPSNRSEQ